MPEVEQWGRGRPSQAKIDKMVEQIRAGYTVPEDMKIPDSVQAILYPPIERAQKPDFLDEVIVERTESDPDFPAKVEAALEARQAEDDEEDEEPQVKATKAQRRQTEGNLRTAKWQVDFCKKHKLTVAQSVTDRIERYERELGIK